MTNPQNPNSTLKQSKVTISVHHNRVRIDSLRADQKYGDRKMESVINEIEFDFDQRVSIRTDVKLSIDDVNQIIEEAPNEMLEEIVFQSLTTDELYLRARAREISVKLKQSDREIKRIEYWDDQGNKV